MPKCIWAPPVANCGPTTSLVRLLIRIFPPCSLRLGGIKSNSMKDAFRSISPCYRVNIHRCLDLECIILCHFHVTGTISLSLLLKLRSWIIKVPMDLNRMCNILLEEWKWSLDTGRRRNSSPVKTVIMAAFKEDAGRWFYFHFIEKAWGITWHTWIGQIDFIYLSGKEIESPIIKHVF